MKRVCAWCNKALDGSEAVSAEDREITHGICDKCLSNVEFQGGVELSRFLNSLDAPVVVCDEDNQMQGLNQAASAMFGVDRNVFVAKKQGVVFECEHARNASGCAKTVHCSGCAIRIAIEQTATTGRGVLRLPATLTQQDAEVRLLITTEKVGSMILLRIDEVADSQTAQP